MKFQTIDLLFAGPLMILIVGALLLVLAEAFFRGRDRTHLMALTVACCVGAAIAAVYEMKALGTASHPVFGGMLVVDRMACFFVALLSATTALIAMISPAHQKTHGWDSGEYYGILIMAASGMAILAMAGDLVSVFIGIETMSLGVYVLTASRRNSIRSTEAAMKYFLMGAFATGFLVYGIALIYGATGTTNLTSISVRANEVGSSPILVTGMFFAVVAFAFKVAAVPFHMWAPDAYEGAPTPVTGFMAAAVKTAAFAAMLRVFTGALGGDVMPAGIMGWTSPLVVIAGITMIVGNVAALRQENIKRMLAYSSISHAGILLVGVIAIGLGGTAVNTAHASVLYYLLAYSVTTVGAFAVIVWVGGRDRERVLIDDWRGLAAKHPGPALAMTICMLSLGGMPPTAGFFGKFYLFKSAMDVHMAAQDPFLLWLVIIGVVNSAISIFYYLRVVMAMYFREPEGEFQPLRSGAIAFVMVLCVLAIFEMGLMPGFWLGAASG